jgi:hypothetical protein
LRYAVENDKFSYGRKTDKSITDITLLIGEVGKISSSFFRVSQYLIM